MLRKRIVFILIAISALALLCPAVTALADTSAGDKTLVAGVDFTLSDKETDVYAEDVSLGTAVTNGVVGSVDKLKKSFGTVLRGQALVFKFTETVDTEVYPALVLSLGKNISSNAQFAFYKNASGETEPKQVITMDTATGIKNINVPLTDYADANGNVSSIIVMHVTDDLETENAYFQIIAYESKLILKEGVQPPVADKELIVGTDISLSNRETDLKIAGKTLGTAVTNGVTGSVDKLKKSFGTVLRGQVLVLKFSEPVNTEYYEKVTLTIGKNIMSSATYAFYKNASGETEPVKILPFGNGSTMGIAELDLIDYADESGHVESIVIEHVTDDLETENEYFQVFVYNSTLNLPAEIAGYRLTANGTDMYNGSETVAGTDKKIFYHNQPTAKLYCNNFTMNSSAVLKFGKPINTADYKTLQLSAKISNLTLTHNYYFELYKTSVTDIAEAVPSDRIAIKSNGNTATFEIDLKKFADENGIVDGIIFYHLCNTREVDYQNASFWIFESDVLTREPVTAAYQFPTSVTGAGYINDTDGNGTDAIILGFARHPFTETVSITGGATAVVAQNILIDGTPLSELNGIVEYIAGYRGEDDKLAVLFKGNLKGDGTEKITIKSGAVFTAGAVGFYTVTDYSYCAYYTQNGQYYQMRSAGVIKRVSAEYDQTGATVRIKFDNPVGPDVTDGTITEKIYVNGVKASTAQGITVRADESDENALVIRIESSSGLLKSDGKDFFSFASGLTTQKLCVLSSSDYYRYEEEDAVLYREGGTLGIFGIEDYKSKSVLVKFSLKINAGDYSDQDDISSSAALKKIKINGENLYEIAKKGEISVTVSGDRINFILERGITGITQTAADRIVIESGFALPTGGVSAQTKYYKYSEEDETFTEFDGVEETETPDNHDNPDSPESPDKPEQPTENGGCNGRTESDITVLAVLLITSAMLLAAIKSKKYKKNGKENNL